MVSCEICRARLVASIRLPQEVSERFQVGNRAKDSMGHAMYFAEDGRTALCIAKRREPS